MRFTVFSGMAVMIGCIDYAQAIQAEAMHGEMAGFEELMLAQISSEDFLSQVLTEAANDPELDFNGFINYLGQISSEDLNRLVEELTADENLAEVLSESTADTE